MLEQLIAISLIAVLAAMSPGPDFAVVVKNAWGRGRLGGVVTAFGIASGVLILSFLSLAGVAVVVDQLPFLLVVIKWLGATYLAYLGMCSFFAKSSTMVADPDQQSQSALNYWQSYLNGLFTNLLNPKCLLFLLSIFGSIVDHDRSLLVLLIAAFIFPLTALLWFSLLSVLITQQSVLVWVKRYQKLVSRIMGLVLIVFAVLVLLIA